MMATNAGGEGKNVRPRDMIMPSRQRMKRAQILQGAKKIFLTQGYERASMSAIAREAGVSKGTLYSYFVSKEALFSTFFEEQTLESFAMLEAISQDDGRRVHDALFQIAEALIALLVTPTCLTLHAIIVGEGPRFPNLAETFWRYGFGRTRSTLAGWLGRRMVAGELRAADPDFAAERFLSLCQTRIVLYRRFALPVDDGPDAIRTFASIAAEDFIRLYGTQAP